MNLESCPCGITPRGLCISAGPCSKYAYVSGSCCFEWNIEFRTNYKGFDTKECMELAATAWNAAVRGVVK